jgi:hypothetical protein
MNNLSLRGFSVKKDAASIAVSTVIAVIILVACSITVAIAASFWMGGIAGQYTKFEKVEIKSAVCTFDPWDNWVITITLKNTGTATSTLISLFVNDIPATLDSSAPTGPEAGITTDLNVTTATRIESGVEDVITVWVGANHATLSSGTTVNVKIHSADGMDYIRLVELI